LEGVLVSTKAEGEIDGAIRSEIGNFGKVNDPSWSGFLAGLLAEVQEALSSV